jgi:hypothetical protein
MLVPIISVQCKLLSPSMIAESTAIPHLVLSSKLILDGNMPPTDDDKDDLLSSCRYGDLDEVQDFVKKFGQESLAEVRDANDNTILHMVCGNGHLGELPSAIHIVIFCGYALSDTCKVHYRCSRLSATHRPDISACLTKQCKVHTAPLGISQLASPDCPKTCRISRRSGD